MGIAEVPQRDGIQSGADREKNSIHHLPLAALPTSGSELSLLNPSQHAVL
jgi:hypothetical protein